MKQEIVIWTMTGTEVVQAEIYGDFGVDLRNGIAVITHIPTGRALTSFEEYSNAVECAKEIVESGVDAGMVADCYTRNERTPEAVAGWQTLHRILRKYDEREAVWTLVN